MLVIDRPRPAERVDVTERQRFGLSAALTTPFDAEGGIDLAKMVAHAHRCLERGCTSVTLFGTTGEGASISIDERDGVFAAMARGGVPAGRIVWGLADSATSDAAAHAAAALAAGCRNVLLPPPFYFKNPSVDGLYDWYAAVLAALGSAARDVILYHIPSVTEVPLPLELVVRLARDFPGAITGLKDSGGDWSYTEALLARRGALSVMVGDERHLAHAVRLGAEGAISGMGNLVPERLLGLTDHGREDPGMIEMVNAVVSVPVTPAVKALVAHVTGDAGWKRTRAPLVPTPDDVAGRLAALFDKVFSA
jgi:4-hydroxy-tetrahydrodipicolinate synthase